MSRANAYVPSLNAGPDWATVRTNVAVGSRVAGPRTMPGGRT
jgi:hypothetical protein